MIRIWAKCYKGNKIINSFIYESIDRFSADTFYLHVQEICHKMDIPTPLVLRYHTENYVEFNRTVFKPADFVESVSFDKFILEEASLK
ncbi:MAG: hypothetical protein IJS74_01015 [Clostridia bacterium]|nr:hypothetical protein [Clostridia bacterium]